MIRAAGLIAFILAGAYAAQAETRTVSVSVKDRGFANGLQLRSRETATVFFSLPRPDALSRLRIQVVGAAAMPSLQRGSTLISVNGQPVDSFVLSRADGIVPIQREIAIDTSRVAPGGSMNVRFDTELLTDADPCTSDYDSANVVSILPQTTVSFDVDLDRIKSLADAVQLLPRKARIVLPAGQQTSPAAAQAALQIAVLMLAHGVEPQITQERGEDIAAIRLRPIGAEGGGGEVGAVLERDGGKLDIVIDPARDVVALLRLWQLAPAGIMGGRAAVGRVAAQPEARSDFREFSSLPPAQSIRQTGRWLLNFPLLAEDGRAAQRAIIKMAIAPDWSGVSPIATVYLNDQLVTAQRLNVGENEFSFALPQQALNFSNVLRIVVDRANDQRVCTPPTGGHAVQILPGSGVTFGHETAPGFTGFAHRFASGGTVVLPADANRPDIVGPYILLTARILAAFGSHAENTAIVFGAAPAAAQSRATMLFETAGPEGLQVAVPARAELLNLASLEDTRLAGLFSSEDGATMRVVLARPGEVPAPASLYLRGGGANAIVSDSGVIWYDARPPARMSLLGDMQDFAQTIEPWLRQYGLAVLFATIALIVLVILSRRLLMIYFRSSR